MLTGFNDFLLWNHQMQPVRIATNRADTMPQGQDKQYGDASRIRDVRLRRVLVIWA
jgi:hypothetical protein